MREWLSLLCEGLKEAGGSTSVHPQSLSPAALCGKKLRNVVTQSSNDFFLLFPLELSELVKALLHILAQKGLCRRTEPVSARHKHKPFKKCRTCSLSNGKNTAGSPGGACPAKTTNCSGPEEE